MKASVDSNFAYEAIVGVTTIISGILGGSKALAIGGIICGYIATFMTNETLKSVPHILRYDITPEQRERLVQLVRNYFAQNNIYTRGQLLHSGQAFMGGIIQIVIVFLRDIGYKCSIP